MFTPELANVDFQECRELPPSTLVAPLSLLREIRCALGPTKLNLLIGTKEAVLVSSDLFEAFNAWEQDQEDDMGEGHEDPELN